ncbi:uncharacterized protein N7518_002674 [Penicillium psychrosexuale]|uniref:uncharacterized protein n=1 Tax=Penicillium psychrosexuale TaxID=1002107 RepID=UPI0025451094|nr:uncharacterized protein N7518_002674 [Penicillium psychrosexuale]KAJ5800606.1 hypothetical protein N7518_002674 [Penicillium psychrosexuale]
MSQKRKTPATAPSAPSVSNAPNAPTTFKKGGKRQRPRGGKKIRAILSREKAAKELKDALASAAITCSAAGAGESSTAPPVASPSTDSPTVASQAPPPAITTPVVDPPAVSPSMPSTTSAVVPTVGAAYRITLASLVPGMELTDEEVEDLSGYLPSVITTFIQDRRVTLEVPWDLWA